MIVVINYIKKKVEGTGAYENHIYIFREFSESHFLIHILQWYFYDIFQAIFFNGWGPTTIGPSSALKEIL